VRSELFPVLEVVPPEDPSILRAAAARAARGRYDWIVLTSANGVRALAAALAELKDEGGAAAPAGRIAVVGTATAAAVEREGWRVDLTPDTYTAEGLLDAFGGVVMDRVRVLVPAAEAARDILPEGLRTLGAEVERVVAYRSAIPEGAEGERLRTLLGSGALDLVTLASPSAAEALLELAGDDALRVPAAVVGPVTADAAKRLGFQVVAVAEPHTADGLVEAVCRWLNVLPPTP
jgi:uroporphyrinogen-III synthase